MFTLHCFYKLRRGSTIVCNASFRRWCGWWYRWANCKATDLGGEQSCVGVWHFSGWVFVLGFFYGKKTGNQNLAKNTQPAR